MEKQFVAFQIAEERYCIDIMHVHKVVRKLDLTKTPNFPQFVEGIVNLQGKIIPVISIHKKINPFSQYEFSAEISFKLLIVNIDDIFVGISVEYLDQILTVDSQQIQHTDVNLSLNTKMLAGMIHSEQGVYYIINIDAILANEEQEVLNQVVNTDLI